jgi:toxin-antitoxin system PIN domain toxin
MILLDVNVLIYAFWPGAAEHRATATWLTAAASGDERVIVPDVVLSGYLRIVTGSRVFQIAEPLENALAFAEQLLLGSAISIGHASDRHWGIFAHLCKRASVRGKLATDAILSAMAIEAGATLVPFDRDFARFPGLTWRHALSGPAITNVP